jgi:hypothetical protein
MPNQGLATVLPADALDRAAIDSLLNGLLRRTGGIKTLRFSSMVEPEDPGTGGYAETATDAAFLVNYRFFVHSGLLAFGSLL